MNTSFYRSVVLIVAMFFFLAPAAALAQDQTNPAFNTICWQKIDCLNARAQLACGEPYQNALKDSSCDKSKVDAIPNGFVSDASAAPCTGGTGNAQWGRCLPAGVTKTEISFGGKSSFTNIGDFIQYNYKYLIAIAAILATIVIVISGAQWVVSGGNSEIISSAKKRIGGAIIGLFLAYSSYFILNTINPNLVNFRLPQTWMVRAIQIVPQFCSDLSPTTSLALASPAGQQSQPISPSSTFTYDKSYASSTANNSLLADFPCGARFVSQTGETAACFGDNCVSSTPACINIHLDNVKNSDYYCADASVAGTIAGNYIIPPTCLLHSGYVFPYLADNDSENGITALCDYNGKIYVPYKYIESSFDAQLTGMRVKDDPQNKIDYFILPKATWDQLTKMENSCKASLSNNGTFIGFGLLLNINRSCSLANVSHLVGNKGQDLGIFENVDLGFGSTLAVLEGNYSFNESDLFTGDQLLYGEAKQLSIDVSTFSTP